MKILVIGNGGREHAIVAKLRRDDATAELFCAPGNAGTAALATNIPVAAGDVVGLTAWCQGEKPDLVVVGPEVPLCAGVVDSLAAVGIPAFGPCKAAARMEGSKQFAKEIMAAAGVPTAECALVRTEEEARAAVGRFGIPVVFKADGLAAGKGVIVCLTPDDVERAIAEMLRDRKFGDASDSVLIEQFLDGEEASLLAFVDGEHVVPLASAQDHKRLLDADRGPNTGGMGAYSPAPCVTPGILADAKELIFLPVVRELAKRGITYKGVLYAGLMLTAQGPKVLEFNCRFGDPETQAVLARLDSPLVPALRACIDGTLDASQLTWSRDAAVCVVMAAEGYPEHARKGDEIHGLDDAAEIPQVSVLHAGTRLGANGAVLVDGGRVLGVTARGETIKDAVGTAYRAVLKIKFDGAQYRTDIAYRALKK